MRMLQRLAIIAALGLALAAQAQTTSRTPDVGFVPTPEDVVAGMLRLANVKRGDVVYDLGSGDGRVVITAANRYGARGVGIELNPVWVREAERFAATFGVTDKVSFRVADLFTVDLREATVVMFYLLPAVNRKLAPKLLAELRPGARIVSHEYGLGDWPADIVEDMVVNGERHRIYVWTVRAPGEAKPK
jgi:SAM-dependent methyltransferase